MRLTGWHGGDSGIQILIDVLSGEGIELEDYHPNYDDSDPHGKIMAVLMGRRNRLRGCLRSELRIIWR
jgi:hypothetical protein